MQIGTHVRLRNRHTFRNGQPDLSEAVGAVCECQEDDDDRLLVSVVFHEHGVIAPCVPVELFEVAVLS